ncbi:MAG TPA: hypothetical protein VNC50_09080 [Planctomycetia bacterium]|nr:hypothetical protein [Planctomycetia bacterium]
MQGHATHCYREIALSRKGSVAQLREFAGRVLDAPAPVDGLAVIGHEERLRLLAFATLTLRHLPEIAASKEPFPGFEPGEFPDPKQVDPGECLRTLNRIVDQWVAIISHPDPARRVAEAAAIANRLRGVRRTPLGGLASELQHLLERENEAPVAPVPPNEALSPTAKLAHGLADAAVPVVLMEIDTGVSNLAQRRLTALLCVWIAHHAEKGKYPEKLDAKALGLPPEALVDPATGKPFQLVDKVPRSKRRGVYVLKSLDPDYAFDGETFPVGHPKWEGNRTWILQLPR